MNTTTQPIPDDEDDAAYIEGKRRIEETMKEVPEEHRPHVRTMMEKTLDMRVNIRNVRGQRYSLLLDGLLAIRTMISISDRLGKIATNDLDAEKPERTLLTIMAVAQASDTMRNEGSLVMAAMEMLSGAKLSHDEKKSLAKDCSAIEAAHNEAADTMAAIMTKQQGGGL
jgi:hypothetical protein